MRIFGSSVAESDSGDAESGFEETDPSGEVGAGVIRSVSRFVDRVCNEGGVSSEHIRSLHQMIPGLVSMHVEYLDMVHRESKRLPPIQKDGLAMDEFGVAAALLPLSTAFCRKLCTGVIQFAYMCIQEHPVWQNQAFWEAAYYQDVQKDIKALYLEASSSKYNGMSMSSYHPSSPRAGSDLTNNNHPPGSLGSHPLSKECRISQEPSALEIAAEQMRLYPNLPPEKQKELAASEESTLYSQAIHYATRMVYLLVPLDVGGGAKTHHRPDKRHPVPDDERLSNSMTNK
ncbi:myotubularin-related protein 5-like [Diaphorina citri]|uniref:Myotubularin-related protein 5-like n=1 Tax=Diaphorina citri TaxID=121845 RepID=A0A3Q0IXA9_DIACI|nr:myotubularin-related protein 5-like [Diaphorina citri]